MSRQRARGAVGRYAPLATICAALVILAVLPSALNAQNPNPETTLEYAPVPPDDEAPPPVPAGNISSLGLAGSTGITETDLGAGDGLGPGDGGIARSPRTKRCIGNPPRQTEDL